MGIAEKFDALVPTSMHDLMEFAVQVSKSKMIPREYQGQPADCLIAMSMGMEIGLKPVQSLQSIAVINGRPSLWGTAARALVMASGQVQSLFETAPDEVAKTQKARCEIVRKGYADAFVGEFSIDDARRAQLLGKDNYSKYPREMLAWRAFHMAARKAFPDIYKGLAAAEEMDGSAPFENGRVEKAPVTLQLDPPPEASPEPPPPAATTPKRGRPPKQEPQATPAAEPPPTAKAPCGFCHKEGHDFNDCPEQKSTAEMVGKTFPEAKPAEPEKKTKQARLDELLAQMKQLEEEKE